jgi:hypothetical protein
MKINRIIKLIVDDVNIEKKGTMAIEARLISAGY